MGKKLNMALCILGIMTICGGCSTGNKNTSVNEVKETSDVQIHTTETFDGLENKKEKVEKEEELPAGSITADEALILIEKEYGKNGSKDENTGNERSYVYEDIQTSDGQQYYNFRYSWIIYNKKGDADHISQLGNIFVSMDGSVVQFAEKTEDGWQLSNANPEVMEIFQMQPENGKDSVSTLILNTDYTFQFSYNPFMSSSLPYGKFEIKKKEIICTDTNNQNIYVFDVLNDDTISFNQKKSSELNVSDESFSYPTNGSVFKKIEVKK